MLKSLNARLADKQLTVELTDAAKAYVVQEGYDPIYGARPLKRFLQRKVETLIAKMIIEEDVPPRSRLIVDEKNGAPVSYTHLRLAPGCKNTFWKPFSSRAGRCRPSCGALI